MAKSYEELAGNVGRAQRYRRRRYDAAKFFGGEPPVLYFDDYAFELKDISGSGFGGAIPLSATDDLLADVNRIGVLRLVQHGKELYAGAARKARTELRGGKIFSGFALEQAPFDLADLQRRNAAVIASLAPAKTPDIDSHYKAFCADALNFVAGYLDRIERSFDPIEDVLTSSDTDHLARELAASAASGWRTIVMHGNDFVIPRQRIKRERLRLKLYTERVLTRTLLDGEGWSRTYFKPMGYPGDYCIMNYIYDGDPIGEDVKSKFLHLLSLVGAEPVKTRMHRLAELIAAAAADSPLGRPCRALSIGAGPTREADGVLRLSGASRPWRFTLLDQEEAALEYSMARVDRLKATYDVECRALNASFKEMLDPTPIAAQAGDSTVIYSAGLVDYLNPLLARRLVRKLYDLIEPGGSVIIGNVNDKNTGMMWPSEYVVDWTLFFRSKDEMIDMASDIPNAKVSIETDALDAINFLILKKPA